MYKIISCISHIKKIIFIILMLNVVSSYAQQPVKGKIKIYLHSIRCEKETLDDIFEGDGKGDEVFVTLFYSVASSNGTTKFINKITTNIYGDIRNWPARVKAGSAGSTGGIKAADVIYAHPQTEAYMPIGDERFKGLLMIDADLEAGDILTIIPVLWEWDSNTKNVQNSLESYLWGAMNNVNVYMAGHTQKFDMRTYQIFGSKGSNCINMQGITQILQGVNGVAGNRPIGMTQSGSFDPEIIVFNSVIMENWQTLIEPYFRNTGNSHSVRYDEIYAGNTRDHGQYTLLLNPEFIKALPSAIPANTNTSGTIKPIKQLSINDPKSQAGILTSNKAFYVGNWSGTQTNDYGQYPQAVSFQLTNSNEFLITDNIGTVAARGTYTLSGNTISGTYKLYSSSDTFSFTGSFDVNTQKLICTLGLGTSTTGQGKLTMTKK